MWWMLKIIANNDNNVVLFHADTAEQGIVLPKMTHRINAIHCGMSPPGAELSVLYRRCCRH